MDSWKEILYRCLLTVVIAASFVWAITEIGGYARYELQIRQETRQRQLDVIEKSIESGTTVIVIPEYHR